MFGRCNFGPTVAINMSAILENYPSVFRVRQLFERPRIEDVASEVQSQLASLSLADRIRPAQTVAITAGSRGIANIALILRAIVDHLRQLGATPFIVPAMGSHGGGTAAGQRQLLEGYGIVEAFCGCPIRASMETVVVGRAAEDFPVHFDRHAFEADHVVVCGRVKPHTDFAGDLQSGLMKMLLIGLGKHEGAKVYHRAIKDYDFGRIVRSVAAEVMVRCSIVAGVAIVENGCEETARIEAVRPEDFESRDKQLLQLATRWMPRLPFPTADLLLIDQIGKDISGTGLDTNVVGRKRGYHGPGAAESPNIRYIAVRGLTDATRGNATGLGLAEFCLSRVVRQSDREITRINSLTGGRPEVAMTPLDYATDRQLLDAVLPTIGLREPHEARLLWIRDTLHLAELMCSAAYWEQARCRPDLQVLSDPSPLPFDAAGNLPDDVMNG
jgi:hypothetical protein